MATPEAMTQESMWAAQMRTQIARYDLTEDYSVAALIEIAVSRRVEEIVGLGGVRHQAPLNVPGNTHPGPAEQCQVPGCGGGAL